MINLPMSFSPQELERKKALRQGYIQDITDSWLDSGFLSETLEFSQELKSLPPEGDSALGEAS